MPLLFRSCGLVMFAVFFLGVTMTRELRDEDLAGVLDEAGRNRLGHVRDVGAGVDVGPRALLELGAQGRAAGELELDVGPGVLLDELGLDLVERVGQRCRREDGDFALA